MNWLTRTLSVTALVAVATLAPRAAHACSPAEFAVAEIEGEVPACLNLWAQVDYGEDANQLVLVGGDGCGEDLQLTFPDCDACRWNDEQGWWETGVVLTAGTVSELPFRWAQDESAGEAVYRAEPADFDDDPCAEGCSVHGGSSVPGLSLLMLALAAVRTRRRGAVTGG